MPACLPAFFRSLCMLTFFSCTIFVVWFTLMCDVVCPLIGKPQTHHNFCFEWLFQWLFIQQLPFYMREFVFFYTFLFKLLRNMCGYMFVCMLKSLIVCQTYIFRKFLVDSSIVGEMLGNVLYSFETHIFQVAINWS